MSDETLAARVERLTQANGIKIRDVAGLCEHLNKNGVTDLHRFVSDADLITKLHAARSIHGATMFDTPSGATAAVSLPAGLPTPLYQYLCETGRSGVLHTWSSMTPTQRRGLAHEFESNGGVVPKSEADKLRAEYIARHGADGWQGKLTAAEKSSYVRAGGVLSPAPVMPPDKRLALIREKDECARQAGRLKFARTNSASERSHNEARRAALEARADAIGKQLTGVAA